MTIGIAQEYTVRPFMHGARFYIVAALIAPILMAAIAAATKHPWAVTITTAMYTATHLAFTWILPLFPAEPKLGPVYQKITHLIPPDFPMLLIVPAIVIDLVRRRIGGWNRLGPVGGAGRGVSRELCRGAVAVCGFSDVAGFAQLDFRDRTIFPYFIPSPVSVGAQSFFPDGCERHGVLGSHGHRAACCDHHD